MKELRVGTKIKITYAPSTELSLYAPQVGDIGTLCDDSTYHEGSLRDRDGCLWFKPTNREALCTRLCMGATVKFRVLRY